MLSIIDKSTREGLIYRINSLNENNAAAWGSMSLNQMLEHYASWEEMVLRNKKFKRSFLGRLFGQVALKSVVKDDAPLRKNSPTSPELIIRKSVSDNVASAKKKWIDLINEYDHYNDADF